MGNYSVRYGFGKDVDKLKNLFLDSNSDVEDADILIDTAICFARYMPQRSRANFNESPVLYKIHCNLDMLNKLIDWLNSLECGIEINLLKEKETGSLYSFRTKYLPETFSPETIFNEFIFGLQYSFLDKDSTKDIELRGQGLKGLSISECDIELKVTSESTNIKYLVEFITLVVLRIIDYRENFLIRFAKYTEESDIIDFIISSSNFLASGHSIFSVGWDSGNTNIIPIYDSKGNKTIFLDVDMLKNALNVKNMEEIEKSTDWINKIGLSVFRQNGVIRLGNCIRKGENS